MADVLNRNVFLVKEHVGMFKAANEYDVFDPHTGERIALCREPGLSGIGQTPFDIHITTPQGEPIVRVTRGWTWFRSKVAVLDEADQHIGSFQQKLLSVGGAFTVLGPNDEELCRLQGKWTGWDFRFTAGDTELAHVTKKWAGIGKELFTSADNYVLEISEEVPSDSRLRQLILAAVMSIDMVLKE